jgi:uncharacterized protein YigE (DUF2233 family)
MLVMNGRVHPRFDRRSTSLKARNGVGVRPDGKVLFAISQGEVSFDAFARLFRDGLNCPNALFLDGGALRACMGPRSIDLATSYRLARCWLYTREPDGQVGGGRFPDLRHNDVGYRPLEQIAG